MGALLVTMAALGAFVIAAGEPVDNRVPYVVAAQPIAAGSVITAADLRVAAFQLDPATTGRSVSDIDLVVGTVALARIESGDLISRTDIAAATAVAQAVLPEVTFPVDPDRTPRALQPGETVAVFATTRSGAATTTEVVARNARVVHVDTDANSLGSARNVVLTVALPGATDVVAFVHATQVADLEIVRSNGEADPAWLDSAASPASPDGDGSDDDG